MKVLRKINFEKKNKLNTNLWKEYEISEELCLTVGTNLKKEQVKISEKGLYQNILIVGTIGSGKTSSAMYPFTKQLMEYKAESTKEKLAMLILDVKGNYSKKVIEFAESVGRAEDVNVIDLTGRVRYNPLDKPNLTPIVLANRLKTILELFNRESSESYWLDKAEQILAESIKFCRIYNDGYVDFMELHKLIMFPEYYAEKIKIARKKFENGLLKENDIYNLLSCVNFFDKEFFSLDERTLSILKSEISRITNVFVSDYYVSKSFCPNKQEINFKGFEDVLDEGKIVVLNMNIAEYKNLSKIIAAYLKLDFQGTVLSRLSNGKTKRKTAFISDEYHEYVTSTDGDFFAQAREAKCVNIVTTQSYTSLQNGLKDEASVKVIIQSLVNKFWFRMDDNFTIEEVQKLIGKEDKKKVSTTISESAKETNYNLFRNQLVSRDTNISESFNKYLEKDFIYDTQFFSQELETFESLAFISNGNRILLPQKLHMIPYFQKEKNKNWKGFDLNE
ncbi:MAG: type IV secretion system DNA-binding domain-containing protein [Clostridia bacterium]|nr:type IV secretion system DNA-binding domain-containing protein [Clostridia bacterium]